MREYGQIQCSLWGHPDIVGLSDQGKLLAIYLLAGPHSNGLGCYRLPSAYVHVDLEWTTECVEKTFQEIESDPVRFCQRCPKSHYVLVPNYLRWNPISNGKVAIARRREYEDIPSSFTLFQPLATAMRAYGKHWPEGFQNQLEKVIRSRSERVSDHDQEGLQDHDLKGYGKQDPTLPYPTLSCAKGESVPEFDPDTGEVLRWESAS